MDNTAPAQQVIVELLNGDVFTFCPEDLSHMAIGDVLGVSPANELELVVATLRDPDGWVEFGGATIQASENEWEEPDMESASYSRTTIFARHVVNLVTVYDEPPRMDLPPLWSAA